MRDEEEDIDESRLDIVGFDAFVGGVNENEEDEGIVDVDVVDVVDVVVLEDDENEELVLFED